MILPEEIRTIAKEKGISPSVIEKDYVLSWIIAALDSHKSSDNWLFKGGTALKKCYFHEYRFSEDLDYSLLEEKHISPKYLEELCNYITNWIYNNSGIKLYKEQQKVEILENIQENRQSAQIRLYYKGPISPTSPRQAPRIKLDLLYGECITDIPNKIEVYHPYSDKSSFNPMVTCYSFNELFAEKLRAFIERCRPRDIYDIVHCFEDGRGDLKEVSKQFIKKCNSKNISINDNIIIMEQLAASRAFWEEQLSHQIKDLGSFHEFSETVIHHYTKFTEYLIK